MRVRAQCARAAACWVGVVYHDGEEDRARRFDHGEEPVPGWLRGRKVERQPVLQRGLCLYLLPEFVNVNGWPKGVNMTISPAPT